jgi:hypothetical protein
MPHAPSTALVPAALRPQLQMSGALARERLLEIHFRYLMELVDHAQPVVDPSRALSIYIRLHGLRNEDANALFHKLFVALGRRSKRKPFVGGVVEDGGGWESPQSVLGLIRRRLRGRVNTELREWVEYHTGRAETELLWAHVENALEFGELLKPVLGMGDVVTLYASELAIPPGRTETIYYLALAHRSATATPNLLGEVSVGDRAARTVTESAAASIRMVESRRTARRQKTG